MHLGRRLGNLLGGFCPQFVPTSPPDTPFLDIRPVESNAIDTVSLFVQVERFEVMTHLFVDGNYSQTKGISFSPVETAIYFDLEDIAGGFIFSAVLFRRDDPNDILAFTNIQLTGAGPVEQSSNGSVQSITPLAGNWFRVAMDIDAAISDQYKLAFSISGGTTRVGAPQVTADENNALRRGLTDDLSQWSTPLTPNGVTPSGPQAFDINDGDFTFYNLWLFILEFEEQLLGVQRHSFAAAFSGPNQSTEGPELPTRGILPPTMNNRVHLQWPQTPAGSVQAIVIEVSQDGSAWNTLDEVNPDQSNYVTTELPQGVYQFRLRGRDTAGNLSDVSSIADFNPPIWIEPTDPSVVFVDPPGTTQVMVDGDPVALVVSLGSTPGIGAVQPNPADQPSFQGDTIDHGAGIRVLGGQSHMQGGPANQWVGVGQQEFDIFTAIVLEGPVPPTTPEDDPFTNTYNKVFAFQNFFEIVATEFTDNFFNDEEGEGDYNSGVALVARMNTFAGLVLIPIPVALYTTLVIRATYDGNELIFQVGERVESEPAPGPQPAGGVELWGEAAPNKGLLGSVGPLVVYPQPFAGGDDLLNFIARDVTTPTSFIVNEIIEAPNGISIGFSGLNGSLISNPSTSPSVTEYRLYTNGGTEEFPDYSTPVQTQPTPNFVLPMAAGKWRIVIRASDGTMEDGSFENRLDIDVVEKSPGVLELAGPEPNTLQQLEAITAPGGNITVTGSYRAFQEQAIGISVDVWIFEQDTPIDFNDPPDMTLSIPHHEIGQDVTFNLTPTTVGPFAQEVPHTVVARVKSVEGDYNISGELRAFVTPLSATPLEPIGLRGNTC